MRTPNPIFQDGSRTRVIPRDVAEAADEIDKLLEGFGMTRRDVIVGYMLAEMNREEKRLERDKERRGRDIGRRGADPKPEVN